MTGAADTATKTKDNATMTFNRNASLALASLVALGLASAARASTTIITTLTDDGGTYSAPIGDIAQLASGGTKNTTVANGDYTNSNTLGQSFTTGANAGGYDLTSLTLKGNGDAGNYYGYSGQPYELYVAIYSVPGTTSGSTPQVGTSLTLLDTFEAPVTNAKDATDAFAAKSDFFTFNLTPGDLVLSPDMQYAYGLYDNSPNGYGFFGTAVASGDVYSGGTSFSETAPYGASTTVGAVDSNSRTFDVGLTSVSPAPEPSQVGMLALLGLGLGGLLLRARKRAASIAV